MSEKKENNKGNKNKKENEEEEMSEEDIRLKENLDLIVERIKDEEEGVRIAATEALRAEIHSSTTSLSGIPKAIKFLRFHYQNLKDTWDTLPELKSKKLLADVLSVLAMSIAPEGSHESLKFRMLGSEDDLDNWGHEYVRNLSTEIIAEYNTRQEQSQSIDDLQKYVNLIIPFNMKHNAEPEACDLLIEVERISEIINYTDETNCERICLYLINIANYSPEPEDINILNVVLEIYKKYKKFTDAIVIALKLDNSAKVQEIFDLVDDLTLKKQICFILGRQQSFSLNLEDDPELAQIVGNTQLYRYYKQLAKDLDVLEPKSPKDIYKSHLLNISRSENPDPARDSLASSFVNAFVNAGFSTNGLFPNEGDDSKWVQNNKDINKISAIASLGLIHLWDEAAGVDILEKYLNDEDVNFRSGGILGIGVMNSGVSSEHDLSLTLLSDYISDTYPTLVRINAVFALGISYAGSAREDFISLFSPIYEEESADIELLAITSYSLGLIFVGSCNGEIASRITEILLSKTSEELSSATSSRFLSLGLGLLYLGKQSQSEVTIETLKVIEGSVAKYAVYTVQTCAYAGTGSVDQVQELLQACTDHLEADNSFQAVSVIGIALVAMGEEIGAEMAIRTLSHLLQYGEPVIKRAVPLAFGLLSVSNPRVQLVDTLSKLSHESDLEVAKGAIFALGLVGAGTNNSRIAHLLRQLSQYYSKEAETLYIVRLAQGLLHLGKGLMTLNPFHCHGTLMSKVAVASLLGTLHSALDFPNLLINKHYLLYSLVCAMKPKMLMTVDEELNPSEISVRVGQAVDTVGQAGKPKTITGFQTHTTPVLISYGERAELTSDDYVPISSFLENIVILKKNEKL